MPFFVLAILLLSWRVANSGPLSFGDSTFSVPDDLFFVDDGKTIDNGKVMELPLDLSQSNQLDELSNLEANGLPDPQIPGSANDASPNLLVDLPSAPCSDSDSRVKGSARANENFCPANLAIPPSRQSTQEDRKQQDSGINSNPEEQKEDGPVTNPIPPDNICPPPKKLFCCFGREIPNWNSREGCEQFTTLRECHEQGGFPFCCMAIVGVLNAARVAMENVGIGCEKDIVTSDKFPPSSNIIKFPTIPANVIPFLKDRPRPQPPFPNIPNSRA